MRHNQKSINIILRKSKILLFLSLTLLLQSCFTYRTVAINEVIVDGKTYKVTEGFEKRKIKIIAVKDSSLVVQDWEGQREIQKSEIDKIKVKKLDVLLTVGVSIVTVIVVVPAVYVVVALSRL